MVNKGLLVLMINQYHQLTLCVPSVPSPVGLSPSSAAFFLLAYTLFLPLRFFSRLRSKVFCLPSFLALPAYGLYCLTPPIPSQPASLVPASISLFRLFSLRSALNPKLPNPLNRFQSWFYCPSLLRLTLL